MTAVQYSTWLPRQRTTVLIGGVVLLHMAGLWALQSGLLKRATDWVIPVAVVSEVPPPPPPQIKPPPPPPPPSLPVRPSLAPTPLALAPEPVPQPNQTPAAPPTVAATAPVNAPVSATAPVAPAPSVVVPAAPAAPTKVDLPTTVADYQAKSPPIYPAMSRRMGEQGRVVMRVLIGADGVPQQAEVLQSSGHGRLDRAASDAVMRWRYVPGKRGGVPETMWFQVPIEFKLGNE
jgi:protein TonB